MSQAACPSCGFRFENHRDGASELRAGRLVYGTERVIYQPKMDSSAYDTCPKCGAAFVSSEFDRLRAIVRTKRNVAAFVYGMVGLLITAVAATIWLSAK